MEGMIEDSMSRGKPRRRWEDDVKDWLSMDVVGWQRTGTDGGLLSGLLRPIPDKQR